LVDANGSWVGGWFVYVLTWVIIIAYSGLCLTLVIVIAYSCLCLTWVIISVYVGLLKLSYYLKEFIEIGLLFKKIY
jgi:hypothetical protein